LCQASGGWRVPLAEGASQRDAADGRAVVDCGVPIGVRHRRVSVDLSPSEFTCFCRYPSWLLKAMITALQAENAKMSATLLAHDQLIQAFLLRIAKPKKQVFGKSSEKIV
jgi:hypothetical protein